MKRSLLRLLRCLSLIMAFSACKDKSKQGPDTPQPVPDMPQQPAADIVGVWGAQVLGGRCIAYYSFDSARRYKAFLHCNSTEGLQSESIQGRYSLANGQIEFIRETTSCPGDALMGNAESSPLKRGQDSLIIGPDQNIFFPIPPAQLEKFLTQLAGNGIEGCFVNGHLNAFKWN